MTYTINELRLEIFGKVYEVYEIFQNFFGEGHTDLQQVPADDRIIDVVYACTDIGNIEPDTNIEISEDELNSIKDRFLSYKPFIMVWWPSVTVTNENNRSVQIQDLYAKIQVNLEGRIPYESRGFFLNRTTFTEIQFNSGYCHSHVPRFSGVPGFQSPCLGTGPINNTIMDLKNGCEEALWMLFCQELALYVTVESLRGGPYFRMESIGSSSRLTEYTAYNKHIERPDQFSSLFSSRPDKKEELLRLLRNFSIYYLEHGHLCFNYKDGSFVPGMPYHDFIIDISNSFIEWVNRTYSNRDVYSDIQARDTINEFYNRGILIKGLVANGAFYELDYENSYDYSRYEGTEMFLFKEEIKRLHIIAEENAHMEVSTLLNHKLAMYILNSVLKIINYRYRNEHNREQTGDSSSERAITPAYQAVIYL